MDGWISSLKCFDTAWFTLLKNNLCTMCFYAKNFEILEQQNTVVQLQNVSNVEVHVHNPFKADTEFPFVNVYK